MSGATRHPIHLKRAYEPADPADGTRMLVERLWPRGIKKEALAVEHWFKDIAPSPELRKWYGHEPDKWPEFQARYRTELEGHGAHLGELRALCAAGPVTFVYAAKDEQRNSAVLLRNFILETEKGSDT